MQYPRAAALLLALFATVVNGSHYVQYVQSRVVASGKFFLSFCYYAKLPAESPDDPRLFHRRLRKLHVRRECEMYDERGTTGVLLPESTYGRPARAVYTGRVSK